MLFKQLFILLSGINLSFCNVLFEQNNVCKNFSDYYHPNNNKNCYYDPDTLLETPALIKKLAGNVEIHQVTTEDGYILTMYRIPRSNPKGVILLHHSIATNSRLFLWQANNSLAITLWRNGFDVWLANHRGTFDSDKHVTMTTHDFRYWDFSFNEMGVYDVSSELKLIREKTNGSKVIYLGHSLGSTVGLVYASVKSEEAKSFLKAMVLVATPYYFEHGANTIVPILLQLQSIIELIRDFLQMGSPLLFFPILIPISRMVLRWFPSLLYIAHLVILLILGQTPNETDPTFFNFDAAIYANNFSWKTLIHFVQVGTANHQFQMYDYGKNINLKIYGKELPALYPVKKIQVPSLLVSSSDDNFITLKDSEILFEELSPEAKVYGLWKLSGLNHLDYLNGLHRWDIFGNDLLKFLNNL